MFNKEEFANLLLSAMGERSINKYALETEISSTYISRLLRSLVEKAPGVEVIKKLASKAHNGVSFEMLMTASGHLDTPDLAQNQMQNSSKTGKRLMEGRINMGYSIKEAAKIFGVTPATLTKYESGRTDKLTVDALQRFSEIYGDSAAYLAGFLSRKDEEKRKLTIERLTHLRNSHNLTIEDLVKSINADQTEKDDLPLIYAKHLYFSEETGLYDSVSTLECLSKFYGVSTDYLLCLTDVPSRCSAVDTGPEHPLSSIAGFDELNADNKAMIEIVVKSMIEKMRAN